VCGAHVAAERGVRLVREPLRALRGYVRRLATSTAGTRLSIDIDLLRENVPHGHESGAVTHHRKHLGTVAVSPEPQTVFMLGVR
jgi:hypothetical protein